MARSIRVAALQLRARDRSDFPGTMESIVACVREAASEADLVVLPEATFPAYVLGDAPLDESAITSALERLREIAAQTQTVVVAGAAIGDDGAVRNAAVAIDADGSFAGRADKLFLWHFDRRWFAPGEHLAPIETRIGNLGILVCADGRLPTIARALVDSGAEALVMPTAWVTSGRDPGALENVQADLLGRVRAFENRVPFIAANKCGSELGMVAYCGKSQIIDARGEIVAIAGQREPQTLRAAVTFAAIKVPRADLVQPHHRASADRPLRIAISFQPLPSDIDDRLDLLDDAFALAPGDDGRRARLDRSVPLAWVDDPIVLDPGALVPYRRAGYDLICWSSGLGAPWTQRLARARALELRLYVVVFDQAAQRAFAVDPDGTIVAGTFDDYRLASFAFDPRKVRETAVAPSTDVIDGLDRIAAITRR